jgi:branched-chain amino acid transport system ATP-binding protein
MAILETEDLTKSFGALTAVNRVSLKIEAGTLHSIIGPNGAGKTTLFNLLTGTFAPTSGRIVLDGKEITGTPAHRIAHLAMARSFQRTNVFPAFSLFDNVWVAAFARSKSWSGLAWRNSERYADVAAQARRALGDVGLGDKANQPAREISHGEQRQLELAIALAAPRRRACCFSTSRRPVSPRRRAAGWSRSCARSRAATRSCSSSTRWTSS